MNENQPSKLNTAIGSFIFGGIVGVVGQVLFTMYRALGVPEFYELPAVILTIALIGGVLAILGIFEKFEQKYGMGAMMGMPGLAAGIAEGVAAARSNGATTGEAVKAGLAGPGKIFGVGILVAIVLSAVKLFMM